MDPKLWVSGEGHVDKWCWYIDLIYSKNIWSLKPGETLFDSPLVRLQMQLAVIFILTSSIHFILNLKRLLLPRIVSEILAGIILGPTILGRYYPHVSDMLFPPESEKILVALTRIGYLFFTFLIGVKMDVSMVMKSGKMAWAISVSATMIPILSIMLAVDGLSSIHERRNSSYEFFSITFLLIPFPVIACLLMHLKIINSELGRLALSAALISDMITVVLVMVNSFMRALSEASLRAGIVVVIVSLVYILFIVCILRPIMFWVIKQTPEGKAVEEVYIIFIMVVVLGLAAVGHSVGIGYMLGPFLFGLAVPPGPPLASTLVERFDTIISGLLVPVFSTYSGYKTDLFKLGDVQNVNRIQSTILISIAGKMLATFFPALCCRMPVKDAAALTLILNAKGIVEVGTFADLIDKQLIDEEKLPIAIVNVFLVAAIVPLLVRLLCDPSKKYTGYQQRNILHSPIHAELRILACVHRQDDVFSIFKLLKVSNPTLENLLSVYGLNLEELVGRSTPLLINHQLGQKTYSSEGSRTQRIIEIFNYYKRRHLSLANVYIFTAISPPHLMHEDICSLAFDKSVSLVLLPFHRKWNAKGELILDSSALRTLNSNVLDKAPCSVGVLVDRSKILGLASTSSMFWVYCVVVLYLGGEDDREALAYAKRMARCSRVHLTVIRFVARDDKENEGNPGTDKMLDAVALKDIKDDNSGYCNVAYREEMVKDGLDTAKIIHSLEEKYELIMVGRRRYKTDSPFTLGLSEWSEFPELGPLGDLLASPDIKSAASVLVMQQQNK